MPLSTATVQRWVKDVEARVMRAYGTITAVDTAAPLVALTFDDGPDARHTPRLLEVLERHNARGTFFVIGAHARQHPDILRRIAAGGHAVANHTDSHPGLPLIGPGEQRRQIRACADALGAYGTRLFRPPFGAQKRLTYLNIRSLGYEVVTWNVLVGDWEYHDADELFRRISAGVRPGAIVLLHDRLVEPEDTRALDRGPMIEAVDRVLTQFAGRFRFVTVPELLRSGRPVRVSWVKREVP
jgi:peptidoglycan/xylan/chitin deacetylase (PgdA/CDA1 family)